MTEKSRENKARRNLAKQGYMLRKARGKLNIDNMGGYMIADTNGCIVAGERFNLSLEDIEKFGAK